MPGAKLPTSFEERLQGSDGSFRPEGHDFQVRDFDAGRGEARLCFLQPVRIVHQGIRCPARRGGEQPESDLLEPARGRDFDELHGGSSSAVNAAREKDGIRISYLLMVILQRNMYHELILIISVD